MPSLVISFRNQHTALELLHGCIHSLSTLGSLRRRADRARLRDKHDLHGRACNYFRSLEAPSGAAPPCRTARASKRFFRIASASIVACSPAAPPNRLPPPPLDLMSRHTAKPTANTTAHIAPAEISSACPSGLGCPSGLNCPSG